MDNIRIIKTGINVKKILKQLEEHPDDWGNQTRMKDAHSTIDEHGFPEVEAGVLQLVMGGVTSPDEYVGDTEICIETPAYKNHQEVIRFLKRHFHKFCRCGFLSLPVGGGVGAHIDVGEYYQTKDRYHLSIAGKYRYFCGDESVIVEPGTLLWFNNKLEHGSENVADEIRVTFVFDVPHSKKNP